MLDWLYIAAHLGLMAHWRRLPVPLRLALLPLLAQAIGIAVAGPHNRAYWREIWWPIEWLALAGRTAVTVNLVRRESESFHVRFALAVFPTLLALGGAWRYLPAGDEYSVFLAYRALLLAALALAAAILLALDWYGALLGNGVYRRAVGSWVAITGLTSGWVSAGDWQWQRAAVQVSFILMAVVVTVFQEPTIPPDEPARPDHG